MITRIFAAAVFSVIPAFGFAQDDIDVRVSDCDWQSSAWNLVEPWEANTRTFSNGKTRLALLDTIEPAIGWAHLLVLSPPYGELGGRQCKVIGISSHGFSGIEFDRLASSYDPAKGLSFTVPVQAYDTRIGDLNWFTLAFTLNQATGAIATSLTR